MKDVEIEMLPLQLDFLEDASKWAAARGGIGSGKTMAMVWWIIQRLEEYPSANHVVVGADYEQLRRGFFQSILGVLEQDLGYEAGTDFTYRETPTPMLRFTHNGARLRSLSAEIAQRIRSVELQTIYCEEPQTWHNGRGEETFATLANRLRHTRTTSAKYPGMPLLGRATFNPPAVGTWLYDLIEKRWAVEGWPCYRFSLRDNYLLAGHAEYLRNVETSSDPSRWPVEIDGHWATIGGDVYRGFDVEVHTKAPDGLPALALDESKELLWSLDFNVAWMSSVVAQAHVQDVHAVGWERKPGAEPRQITARTNPAWQRRLFYVLDELFLSDSGTPDVVDEFVRRYGDHARKRGVTIYGDPAGGARSQTMSSQAAARSNWEIVIDGLRAAGIRINDIRVQTAAPSVMDRINAVRAQFRTGDGYGLVVDVEKCPELIRDFLGVRFAAGTNDIDKSDKSATGVKRTHLSDAAGYLLYVERRLAQREPITFRQYMQR